MDQTLQLQAEIEKLKAQVKRRDATIRRLRKDIARNSASTASCPRSNY